MATGEVTEVLRKLSPGAQVHRTCLRQTAKPLLPQVLSQVTSKSSLPLGEEQEHKERTYPGM